MLVRPYKRYLNPYNMKEQPYQEDREQMKELLRQYEDLRTGRKHSFIDEDSYEKIIGYFEERDEMGKALEAANLAIEQYPFSSSLLISKADTLIANRRYQDALDVLDQAALFDSGDINLYILQTDAFLALDQQERAVEILRDALERFEGEEQVELLFELADVYDDYEEFDKVFDCLKMILEQDPTNEEALYKICFWTDFTGRNEESIRLHQRIIDDFPYSELAWFNLAAAYQGLKLYEKAVDAYQYAIVIEEKFDYAYRNMGDAFIRMRRYKDAIEALERVCELAKPELVIFEALGHCHDKLKNFAQARFYYRKASHLNQEDSKLFYKIACTYYNEGQYDAAVRQLESAVRLSRNHPEYSLLLGECRMEQELFKDAAQHFANAVRLRPRGVAGWEALIRCLLQSGLADEALGHAVSAHAATNHKPIFLYLQASALFALGRSKDALIILEKGLTEAPRLLKKFIDLNPACMQNQQVIELIARYKKTKSK